MDHYLYSDIRNAVSSLSSISSSAVDISLELDSIDGELSNISYTLDEILYEMREWRVEQFIQNEHRNRLLKRIDEKLNNPSQTAAEEQYQMALGLIGRKEYELSLPYFLEAIKLNPMHFYARVYLANTYCKLGQFEDALGYSLNALKHTEQKADREALSQYMISKAFFGLGKTETAIHEIEKAIQLAPLAIYYYEASRYYAHEQNSERSMNRLIKAINQNNQCFEYALMDKIYLPIHQNLLETLADIKEQARTYTVSLYSEWEAIHLPALPLEPQRDFNTNPKNHSWGQLTGINFASNFENNKALMIRGSVGSGLAFTYNNYIKEIKDRYLAIHTEITYQLSKAKSLIEKDTYIHFCESIDELARLQKYYQKSINDFKPLFQEGLRRSQDYLRMTEREIPLLEKKLTTYKEKVKGFSIDLFLKKEEKKKRESNQKMVEISSKSLLKMQQECKEASKQVRAFEDLYNLIGKTYFPTVRKREKFSLLNETERKWMLAGMDDAENYPYKTQQVISLLQDELDEGAVYWCKSDNYEWVGTKTWMVKLLKPNPKLISFLTDFFENETPDHNMLIYKNSEISINNAHEFDHNIGDVSKYSQGIITDDILIKGNKKYIKIEWNGTTIFVDNKRLSIINTNIVNVLKERRPLLFGEELSIIILPTMIG